MPRATLRRQRGVSLVNVLVIGAFAFILVIFGSQVGKPYWNAYVLRGMVEKSLAEPAPESQKALAGQIKESVYRRAQVDNLPITPDDVDVLVDGSSVTVEIDYGAKINLWKGATLHLSLPIVVKR